MKVTPEQKEALKYSGLMGHEFVVLHPDLRCSAECNTIESARKDAVECIKGIGLIFQQLPKRQWKRVV